MLVDRQKKCLDGSDGPAFHLSRTCPRQVHRVTRRGVVGGAQQLIVSGSIESDQELNAILAAQFPPGGLCRHWNGRD
jgi:hypothetical protein